MQILGRAAPPERRQSGSAPITLPASLAARLAANAYGWGVVFDGVLDIRTVSDTRNSAALMALAHHGYTDIEVCTNHDCEDCDCYVRFLSDRDPAARIVPVTVRVADDPGP